TRDLDFPSLFWEEGTADLLSGTATFKDSRVVLRPEDLDAQSLDNYITSAHFSRFLMETGGCQNYGRIIRGETFGDVYGEPAEAFTAAYERDAPYGYPPLEPCPFPELPEVEDGVWGETFEISCQSPEATGVLPVPGLT